MKAVVYKSTGSWYVVKAEDDKFYDARIKGKFKIDSITSTNPIAVGDVIDIEIEKTEEAGAIITNIYERKNYITRLSPHNKNQHHIIASNLDQSLLFATLKEPKTSQGFIDRFLVASEAYHVPAIVVFNKSDLYREKEQKLFTHLKDMYEHNGYKVFLISLRSRQGIDEVTAVLKDKVTLLSGHSGVGKSTFINLISPEVDLKTQDVSGWSGKGLHTTTFAEMFDLPFGGKIIDTPGLREFALMDIEKNELSHYFPEMRNLIHDCRFNNCLHVDEPGCAVKLAAGQGKIAADRYISYLDILSSISTRKW